jgi:hypothetical protein
VKRVEQGLVGGDGARFSRTVSSLREIHISFPDRESSLPIYAAPVSNLLQWEPFSDLVPYMLIHPSTEVHVFELTPIV